LFCLVPEGSTHQSRQGRGLVCVGVDRMPRRPKVPCSYPGCHELVEAGQGGRCEKHRRQERQRYDNERGTAAQRGYDARWRQIRAIVLAEEPLCRECSRQGRVMPAKDVHHINGNPRDNRRENLEPLCHECHSRHTARHQAFGRG